MTRRTGPPHRDAPAGQHERWGCPRDADDLLQRRVLLRPRLRQQALLGRICPARRFQPRQPGGTAAQPPDQAVHLQPAGPGSDEDRHGRHEDPDGRHRLRQRRPGDQQLGDASDSIAEPQTTTSYDSSTGLPLVTTNTGTAARSFAVTTPLGASSAHTPTPTATSRLPPMTRKTRPRHDPATARGHRRGAMTPPPVY